MKVPEGGAARRIQDLEWLAERSRKILEDPRKERWHHDTRAQLVLIEAELERQRSNVPVHPERSRGTLRIG